jgi:lysine biosynthesis protein LysW
MAANCPECDSEIDIDEMDVDIGDELSCSECGALVRVASDTPLELELADEDEDDDLDDDEDDDDEDEDEEEEVEDDADELADDREEE